MLNGSVRSFCGLIVGIHLSNKLINFINKTMKKISLVLAAMAFVVTVNAQDGAKAKDAAKTAAPAKTEKAMPAKDAKAPKAAKEVKAKEAPKADAAKK